MPGISLKYVPREELTDVEKLREFDTRVNNYIEAMEVRLKGKFVQYRNKQGTISTKEASVDACQKGYIPYPMTYREWLDLFPKKKLEIQLSGSCWWETDEEMVNKHLNGKPYEENEDT